MNSPNEEHDPVLMLLRQAGRREPPTVATVERVRGAVHGAWLTQLRAQRRQRRRWLSAAAGVAAVVVGAATWMLQGADTVELARITRSQGPVRIQRGGAFVGASAGMSVRRGDAIVTAAKAALVLRTPAGLTLRIGGDSDLRWRGDGMVELAAGRVYVDSGQAGRDSLALRTPTARVEHVGTQFALETAAGRLRVAVRDGLVRVTPARGGALQLGRGEVLEAERGGALHRYRGSADDADWNWVDALAPDTALDGRVLHEVLAELARESGLRLHYDSDDLLVAARSLRLGGSPLRLAPRQALRAVLVATPYVERVRDDELWIGQRR